MHFSYTSAELMCFFPFDSANNTPLPFKLPGYLRYWHTTRCPMHRLLLTYRALHIVLPTSYAIFSTAIPSLAYRGPAYRDTDPCVLSYALPTPSAVLTYGPFV
eukprot:92700-Rhodomonas_salina.1